MNGFQEGGREGGVCGGILNIYVGLKTNVIFADSQGAAQIARRAHPGGEKHIGSANKLRLGHGRGGRDLSEAEQGFERPYGTSA